MVGKRLLTAWALTLALLASPLGITAGSDGQATSRRGPSSVPPWDACGRGPLPWQGISCIDLSDDGRWLAVGTIASAGDPNAFLLDADGKLVRTAEGGQR